MIMSSSAPFVPPHRRGKRKVKKVRKVSKEDKRNIMLKAKYYEKHGWSKKGALREAWLRYHRKYS